MLKAQKVLNKNVFTSRTHQRGIFGLAICQKKNLVFPAEKKAATLLDFFFVICCCELVVN